MPAESAPPPRRRRRQVRLVVTLDPKRRKAILQDLEDEVRATRRRVAVLRRAIAALRKLNL